MCSAAYLDGYRSTVFLLSTGESTEGADGSSEFFSGFFRNFLKVSQSYNAGLSSSYISIIADSQTQTHLENVKAAFGTWHRLAAPLFKTPLHHNSKNRKSATKTGADPTQVYYDFTTLEDLITELASARRPAEAVCGPEKHSVSIYRRGSEMATQLHSLWDAAPWKPSDHVVLDVYWLVSGSVGCSPSSAVQLYGSLLRLKKWDDAHIQIVSSNSKLTGHLLEWKEMLGTPPISTPASWCVNPCVVWRGTVRFTEHKVPRQVQPQVVAFPGFALSLLPTPRVSGTELLAGVGLKGGCPSHLEVIQVVDGPTVPLFWLSPLHCVLSLENTSFPDSVALFSDLLTAKAKQPIGLIMRLCFSEKDGQQGQHRTTADWMSYIQDSELEDVSTPSPLDSYLPGPLLLVCPCDQSDYRCDAWFLWKPESIRADVFHLEGQGLQIAEDAVDTDLCRELPLIELTSEHTHTTTDRDSDAARQQSLHHQLSRFTHELELPPCECPEMMALQMHEWIQRKMIRRLATPDLMFGQVLAPPPSTKDTMDAGDLLSCFTETGSPAACELSPIAMSDPSRMMKIHNPSAGDVSYHSIMASTPSSKKHYHGVNYCLTDGNTTDARLTRIQQCYLVSERASNCSNSNTPRSNRLRKRKASQGPQTALEGSKKLQRESSPGKATSSTSDSLIRKSRKAPPKTIKKMSPVVKVTKLGTVKRLGKKSKPVKVNKKSDPCLPSSTTTPSAQISYQPSTDLHPNESQQKITKTKAEDSSSKLQDHATVKLDILDPTLLDGASGMYTQVQSLRRSPRKNKWQLECSNRVQEKQSQGKKSEQRKRQLEEVIVATLKANNLYRSHPCFRKCYTRLFTLSKSFLKDMKTTRGLAEEMKKVVEFNVSQVIDFELRQAGLHDGGSTDP